ncbi:hypothetical protein RDI58_014940 [Solanum bulbocastanum]|uniref:Uncharacterized protein n=1 Tax=Solanum bulbocastanum TaxID=147425 RepID=A0AAN8YB16_SOLBU
MCAIEALKANCPHVLMMVAWEMLKNGFIPGQGHRAKLDGSGTNSIAWSEMHLCSWIRANS